MTKQEAIEKMRQGIKITHENFTSDEWMTMDGFTIVLEDGVKCDDFEFWRWRTDKSWNDGYSFFKQR